jgi:hypothetical protein
MKDTIMGSSIIKMTGTGRTVLVFIPDSNEFFWVIIAKRPCYTFDYSSVDMWGNLWDV